PHFSEDEHGSFCPVRRSRRRAALRITNRGKVAPEGSQIGGLGMTAPSTIAPIVAETRTYIEVRDPTAYNCFRFAFLRSGSAIVHSEFGERRVRAGNLLMLSANVLCGCEPD